MAQLRSNFMHREKGFVLVMTLMVLVILTLSGMAMMMVMRSGVSTAGNIAFRQAAVRVADLAVEDARTLILSKSAVWLQTDHPSEGYYSTYDPAFSPVAYDFLGSNAHQFTQASDTDGDGSNTTVSGYRLSYVVHRMAMNTGMSCSEPLAGCMFPPTASSSGVAPGSSQSAGSNNQGSIQGATGLVYYRVTIRVTGPRFNNRYVQAFLY